MVQYNTTPLTVQYVRMRAKVLHTHVTISHHFDVVVGIVVVLVLFVMHYHFCLADVFVL